MYTVTLTSTTPSVHSKQLQASISMTLTCSCFCFVREGSTDVHPSCTTEKKKKDAETSNKLSHK